MIDTNNKLQDDITFKKVITLMTCVIKDDNKCYPQLFLENTLYDENAKHLKKDISEELMPVGWHSKRWWCWCLSEDEKGEIDPIFTDKVGDCQNSAKWF